MLDIKFCWGVGRVMLLYNCVGGRVRWFNEEPGVRAHTDYTITACLLGRFRSAAVLPGATPVQLWHRTGLKQAVVSSYLIDHRAWRYRSPLDQTHIRGGATRPSPLPSSWTPPCSPCRHTQPLYGLDVITETSHKWNVIIMSPCDILTDFFLVMSTTWNNYTRVVDPVFKWIMWLNILNELWGAFKLLKQGS